MRLDRWLVASGHFSSRARAQAAIAAGLVTVNGKVAARPALTVGPADTVTVSGDPIGFVGRGGLKLAAALDAFAVAPAGRDCLDVGASTGGFTDCLLQRGARQVLAVDVGTGQLHPRLQADPRVWSLPGTDIRAVDAETICARWGKLPSLAAIDVSFISVRLVLPSVSRLVAPGADLIVLVKPQFEAGREAVGKGGIVRDTARQRQAVAAVADAAAALGLQVSPAFACPVTGGDGNQEYFLHLRTSREDGGEPVGSRRAHCQSR